MSMSSAFAVLRVIIISNRVGCSTSPGFAQRIDARSTPAGCIDDLPHRSDHQIPAICPPYTAVTAQQSRQHRDRDEP
jgi:hypothetical protein